MRLRRLLPGSLDEHGRVVGHDGRHYGTGPCWIPDNISPARKQLMGEAGWHKCPASHYPSLMPSEGMACVAWYPPF